MLKEILAGQWILCMKVCEYDWEITQSQRWLRDHSYIIQRSLRDDITHNSGMTQRTSKDVPSLFWSYFGLLLMITINDLPSQGIHLWGSLFWGIRTGRHFPRPRAVVPPDHCAHMLIIVTVVTSTRPHRKISNSDERDDFWLFLLATSTSYWFPFDFWCPVNLDPL